MQNLIYQIPISVLTPLKLKIKQSKSDSKGRTTQFQTKKEKTLNLNVAEPGEMKSLAFSISLC